MLITYKYQKILRRTKEILWKEPINQVKLLEKEGMVFEKGWAIKVEEKLLLEEDQKEGKTYPLN